MIITLTTDADAEEILDLQELAYRVTRLFTRIIPFRPLPRTWPR
jgi:hypothetical protein